MTKDYATVKCENCQNNFDKLSTEIRRYPDRRHFCSRECYFKDRRFPKGKDIYLKECDWCHKEYSRTYNKKFNNSFCSSQCSKDFVKKRNDFTGKKMGRCVVLRKDENNSHKDTYWLIKCKCKEIFSRRHADVRNGRVYECPNCVFRRSQYYIGGKKFGRLSVQDKWEWRVSPTNDQRFRYWYCICECGEEVWVQSGSILRGSTHSCGCGRQKNNSRYVNATLYPKRHGMSGKHVTLIYGRWVTLVAKCYNQKYCSYKNWGGNGYDVCDAWRNDYSNFHEWMESQNFQKSHTIAIKKGKKIFSPENCYLEDFDKHANKMRHVTLRRKHGIDYQGKRLTLKEWSQELNVSYHQLKNRYRQCKDLDKCINGKWNDGTGCLMRRVDVHDDTIRKLYEDGMSVVEIQDYLGFQGVTYRILKMGLPTRPKKSRVAVRNEKEIKEGINRKLSLIDINKKCNYKTIDYLKRKIKTMGYDLPEEMNIPH